MNETINRILRHPATVPTVVGVVSVSSGFAAGFLFGRRYETNQRRIEAAKALTDETVTTIADIRARREVPKVVVNEEALRQDDTPPRKPEVTVEEHIRRRLEGGPRPAGDEGPPVVASNVFAENITPDDDWDYEVEKRNRDSTTPYILHRDEFFAEEMEGFTKKTFTYWHGDDTLADEQEPPKPIYNRSDVIGDNLRFGHGSGEAHVVYIRNELRREEYEVLREDGLYSVAVLNYQIEDDDIEHSSPRKFRPQE